jgi:hypothetical protein
VAYSVLVNPHYETKHKRDISDSVTAKQSNQLLANTAIFLFSNLKAGLSTDLDFLCRVYGNCLIKMFSTSLSLQRDLAQRFVHFILIL